MQLSVLVSLALALSISAAPTRRADFTLKNGQDAIALNDKFKTLTADSSCTDGEDACVTGQFAQCVGGKFVLQSCGPGTQCAALPLVNSAGTSITCTTQADLDARIAATGATNAGNSAANVSSVVASTTTAATSTSAAATTASTTSAAAATSSAAAGGNNSGNGGATGNNGDAQNSLTLLDSVIATGFEKDGQETPAAGQSASLTSSNNFINFCATVPNKPITNGQQIKSGSCNPAPMGVIAATTNMPSSKFVFPKNTETIKANTKFTIQMALNNLQAGTFVNAQSNYYSAPQQVNAQGNTIGHTHVVIEKLDSLDQTKPTDPTVFAFFKGINSPQQNGIVSADVDSGLPVGVYRIASINAAANHQPVLVAVAQHGSLDDMVYFTVTDDGKAAAGTGAAAGNATASATKSAASSATSATATAKGKN
ncbi:hypothetical protein EW146_g7203 [Bondarzewia mesenterica]|uniref:Carbohydrate-binding module family 19 domain-containing protein n=1 Tax=Bondarzewia mesenterica TaxID=1095465 RepID=A0A4V3XEB6_9AGAM|nr:hypothetical protein EW146_g7203 [Bondarzewia mesenterica]